MKNSRAIAGAVLLVFSLVAIVFSVVMTMHYKADWTKQAQRTQILRDFLADTDHGIVIINPAGQIVEWGPGAEALFGWTSEEVLGSQLDFIMPAEYIDVHKKALAASSSLYDIPRPTATVDCWAVAKSKKLVQVHIIVRAFKNHLGYYHIAMITEVSKARPPAQMPKPKDATPAAPSPTPGPVEPVPTGLHVGRN